MALHSIHLNGSSLLIQRVYIPNIYTYLPGTYFPEHSHSVDKKDTVISGQFRMTAMGKEFILGPGDMLLVPANTVHTAEVIGENPVVSLDATKK